MTKNLQLQLHKKWFDMTNPEEKTEDYRELTEYWAKRLIDFASGNCIKIVEQAVFEINIARGVPIQEAINEESLKFKPFTQNTMTLGYPKSTDKSRIKVFEHQGIEIREGKPEWGAEPGKIYFVIKHGKRIE